jgi:hypothetical protein
MRLASLFGLLVLVAPLRAHADTDPKAFLSEFCAAHRKRDTKYLGKHVKLPVVVSSRVDDNIENERHRRTRLTTMKQVLAHHFLCDADPSTIEVSNPSTDRWVFAHEVGQFDERMTFDRVTTTPRLVTFDN